MSFPFTFFFIVVEGQAPLEQSIMTTVHTFGTIVLTMRTLWNEAGEEFTGMIKYEWNSLCEHSMLSTSNDVMFKEIITLLSLVTPQCNTVLWQNAGYNQSSSLFCLYFFLSLKTKSLEYLDKREIIKI